jgi:hypothetical protein
MTSGLPLITDIAEFEHTAQHYSSCRAAPYRLRHLEPLELRMIQIQRLVVPCPTMRCPKCLRLGPRFKHGTAFPHCVRSIKGVILGFGAFEKAKLYKARDFSR